MHLSCSDYLWLAGHELFTSFTRLFLIHTTTSHCSYHDTLEWEHERADTAV